MSQFFGKYRGIVVGNQDPVHLGRLQIQVPAVYGHAHTIWAMPCTPYAGKNIGLFMIPPVSTNIWVEFEAGDPDYPIWVGCFWGEGELPQPAMVENPDTVQVFQTKGASLTISREQEKEVITLEVDNPIAPNPLKVIFSSDGIEISHNVRRRRPKQNP